MNCQPIGSEHCAFGVQPRIRVHKVFQFSSVQVDFGHFQGMKLLCDRAITQRLAHGLGAKLRNVGTRCNWNGFNNCVIISSQHSMTSGLKTPQPLLIQCKSQFQASNLASQLPPLDSYHVLLFDGKIVRSSFFTAFRASDIRIMCASEILLEKITFCRPNSGHHAK